jgi:hypothetical protein
MPQPCEADFNIELLDGGVRVTFRPTTSEFTYRQLADPDDIAREGPLSRPPNVRHAQTGDTGGYDEREVEALAFARVRSTWRAPLKPANSTSQICF